MTMEVEVDQPEGEVAERMDQHLIIDHLTNNDDVFFKSQQRGEIDLSKQEKSSIALEIYNKSKLNFLMRFGKYLQHSHLNFFQQFAQEGEESSEIEVLLKELTKSVKRKKHVNVKNRRYEALKSLIREDSYFSEIEMMKRNPLLYEQLVGQYLTVEEKAERDRITMDEATTLTKILMEGIERDDAKIKQQEQEEYEDEIMEDEKEDMDTSSRSSSPEPTCSQWGEFIESSDASKAPRPKKRKLTTKHICVQEQKLLKEEFISLMYLHFLEGKDEDFDYDSVDKDEKYDNAEMEHDEEDKYFDSEEPAIVKDEGKDAEESEDELDIYMSALNQHPAVLELTEDIQKL